MLIKTLRDRGARYLGVAGLLVALAGAGACTTSDKQSRDVDPIIAQCKAEICIEEAASSNVAEISNEAGNIISTGDNWWIGMTDTPGNQTLVGWLEQYCQALDDQAGCFGTHGSPGGGLQVTPSACQINAVNDGPPYVLFICSAAAGPNSALDWFINQTCAPRGDVYGCSGTLWVYNPAGAMGLTAYCQGTWQNGNGASTPSFPGSGINFTQGMGAPAGTDWMAICGS
jgi:hypothetical protein